MSQHSGADSGRRSHEPGSNGYACTTCGTPTARWPCGRIALDEVQAYAGHADIATTMRYVHHVPRTMRRNGLSAIVTAATVQRSVHRTTEIEPN